MIRNRLTTFLTILCLGVFTLGGVERVHADRGNRSTAEGTGVFRFTSASTGVYFGPGTDTSPHQDVRAMIYSGALELEPIEPGKYRFQNLGRGTDQEQLQETIYEDGSTISTRYRGIVEETAELDDNGDPTGMYTAVWTGTWVIVRGTGRYEGAKGSFRVNAVNDPYLPTDFNRNFSWSWFGNIATPPGQKRDNVCVLHTEGDGVFDPANLGLGDPNMVPFPFVIGDGSGTAVYNGTPTGTFTLVCDDDSGNGEGGMMLSGPDQHFGSSQSIIGPGTISPAGTFWYPVVSGLNPDGVSGPIHRMVLTDLGEEIWFHYSSAFFELNPNTPDDFLTGRADFRVVGGTGRFEGAGGSVYVVVVTRLDQISGPPDMPAAEFHYDFNGYIKLHDHD
jgi:hypothetical protein